LPFYQEFCFLFCSVSLFKARLNPPLLAGAEKGAAMTKLTSKKLKRYEGPGTKGGYWTATA
jgi:hypothetical protein